MHLVTSHVIKNQDASKVSYIYLDFRLHGSLQHEYFIIGGTLLVYITSILFSYIAKSSVVFLTCWLLSCHKSPHLCKITMQTYHELLSQFTFCLFQVVEVHLFWLRESNKQGNNNCIMQHEYFIIATPYIISEMDSNHVRCLNLLSNMVWIQFVVCRALRTSVN